jgi:hypothetical protein
MLGSRCEQVFNPCLYSNGSSVCLNSARCSINLGAPPFYQCDCQFGFFGPNCQFVVTTTSTTTVSSAVTGTTTTMANVDQDLVMCPFYAANGFCATQYYFNSRQMPVYQYCPVSCRNLAPLCADTQANCAVWVSLKLCPSLANLKPPPCRKSCGLC